MSSFLYNSQSMPWGTMLGIADECKSDLCGSRYDSDYQMRTAQKSRDPYGYASLWTRSKGMAGDPSAAGFLGGAQDSNDTGMFEPLNFTETGSSRLYFIHGVCVDGSGAPLAAAVLELFLSASNTFVSSGTTDSNGIYSLGTPYAGVNHTIVANYGPNTLTGSSVDTLQPVSSPW